MPRITAVAVTFLALTPAPAAASTLCETATISWDGGAETSTWTDPLNWDQDRIPGDEDRVCLGSGEVQIPAGTKVSIKSLDSANSLIVSEAELKLNDPAQSSRVNVLHLAASKIQLMPGHHLITQEWTRIDSASSITAKAAIIENLGYIELEGGVPISSPKGASGAVVLNRGILAVRYGSVVIEADVDNQGGVVLDNGNLRVAGSLRNYSAETKTLSGGRFSIYGGELSFPSTGIEELTAELELGGPQSSVTDPTGVDALSTLNTIGHDARLTLFARHLTVGQALTSHGHIRLHATSQLTVPHLDLVSGSLEMGSPWTPGDARIHAEVVEASGGSILGLGTIEGDLVNSGAVLQPTLPSIGRTTAFAVTGNYFQGPSGTLAVNLDEYPDLVVHGYATLGGTLDVESPVSRSWGYEATFLTRADGSGTFSSVNLTGSTRFGTILSMSYGSATVGAIVECRYPTDWGAVSINDGAEFTRDHKVILKFTKPSDIQVSTMRVSNDPTMGDAKWWPLYRNPIEWDLAIPGEGVKRVYVEFKDSRGVISDVVSASIILDWTPPESTLTPPSGPLEVRIDFSEVVRNITADNLVLSTAAENRLSATRICRDESGTQTDCLKGDVRTVIMRPEVPFAPFVEYTVTVSAIESDSKIVDRAGNEAPWTRHPFTL